MEVLQYTYDFLISLPCAPPEIGGILGGKSGVISTYVIDIGLDTFNNYAHYYPNINMLNKIINNWTKQGISFYGIFHTHFPGGNQLSLGDKKYIYQIMLAMPIEINKLLFPIILPSEIIWYQACRKDSQIFICRDDIKII